MSDPKNGALSMPKGREDVVFRQLTDEWVLFDAERDQLHVLNHTGALVWTACDGETPVGDVVDEVFATFESPPSREEVERDVGDALERFRSEGLLE